MANEVGAEGCDSRPFELWRAITMSRVARAVRDDQWSELVRLLREAPWLLGESCVRFQARLFELAMLNDHAELVNQLGELDPALLHRHPPPPSRAIEFALAYGKARVIPQLLRIWPLPDDLPSAAGMGDCEAVKRWFDPAGEPALGNPQRAQRECALGCQNGARRTDGRDRRQPGRRLGSRVHTAPEPAVPGVDFGCDRIGAERG